METKTDYTLKIIHGVSWIIFIGLCIETAGFIFNTVLTLSVGAEKASTFWKEVDLSELYHYDQSRFVSVTSLMIIAAVLRTIMFYLIVKIFYEKKFKISQPFNETVRRFITLIAWLAMGIGLFSFWGTELVRGLVKEGVKIPDIQYLRLGGADVWLFMGVTMLVISQILKKGIELQNENDLTV